MLEILPQVHYKSDFLYNEERINQIHVYETSENIFNDDLIFSINENIFAMLRIEDLSTERNQIYTYIKQIFDQIIQNHSIQMQFVNKIWSQSLGNLLLNYIKTDNMIEHLLLTLKLIYLLLDAQYAKIFFSENQLNDTVFETLTSFPEEFQLVYQCFLVLSNLLPYLNESFTNFLPEIFSKISLYKDDYDCELSICKFIYKLVQVYDVSPFYEQIADFINSIFIQSEFSNQTLNFILKTIEIFQIQNKKSNHFDLTINKIIFIISNQIKNSSPSMKYKFLKFIKNSILYSEKPKINRLLKKLTFPTFIEIYEEQDNSKIKTIILEILTEILKIEQKSNFFCMFDLALYFDDDLLTLIIHNFNQKSFSEKQAVLLLLAELASFQKPETFIVFKSKNKFIFDKLINFACNSNDFSNVSTCLSFYKNYIEMSLLYENSSDTSTFYSDFFKYEVDKIFDFLIDQDDDKNTSQQALELKKIISGLPH